MRWLNRADQQPALNGHQSPFLVHGDLRDTCREPSPRSNRQDGRRARHGGLAGGRGWLLAARGLLAAGVLVLAATGAMATAHAILQPGAAATEPSTEAFPTRAAGAFAIRAAAAWLTLDDRPADGRPSGVADHRAGLDGVTGLTGALGHDPGTPSGSGIRPDLLTVAAITTRDAHRAVVTVHARLDPVAGRWIAVEVPVVHDGVGGWALSGSPTLAPLPPVAGLAEEKRPPADGALAAELADPMSRFFTAWAASDLTALAYVTPDRGRAAELGGLGGVVQLVAVDGIYAPALPDSFADRLVAVTVTWREPVSGHHLTQTFGVRVVHTGDRWTVTGVGVAPGPQPATPPSRD